MRFVIVNGKKAKQYIIIVFAAFFAAALAFFGQEQLAVFSTKDGPRAIYRGEETGQRIALTFDISWGDHRALPILDTLKKEGIKNCTFFVSAAWAERHPEIVERIVKDGHELESLGYQFKDYTGFEDQQIRRDILTAQEKIKKVSGKTTSLLRPPNGSFDQRVLNVSEKLKHSIVHWSVDTKDWRNPGVNQIVKNATKKVKSGDILLLHASDSAKQTEQALPEIIGKLKSNGYSFVSVEEMIANTKAHSEEVR
ncbi:polysaccharide deacetylase family sporulation protein PdaB [Fictibacillus macauensis ZFHKF-1]|uniref:Polysaccharide deacetylase family sporulation protein PdaB n=1 Tax=Fictibacillus macauensis ZFHKF-1 TaxID=1196324 RepID=I8UB57_9BACL|nr:polysaccharide deacetylase family sporulation protein PdaB [Fictibacillus macauensis]EIT84013.1 polysaccharide deacetylase family sporulation protein PdaB [Fictibacillus macauensis ZFHKF-1]